ncbi:MAG: histidine kinase [Clostridiales bacterium]|nr:histidine kinase [Clostridiales bacterium]
MDNLKFIIPGKPEYLTMVRLAISSIATTAGFDLEAVEDMKTAVCEACKNVSCHGFDGFSDKYEVDCNVEEGRIEIIVKDACDSHTLQKLTKPCQNCPKEGDLGIFVIESLMNDVEFGRGDDGRKSIRMVKSI